MSTQITTEMIKELRDATGVSVMQCKKALEEADGNMEKALMVLKKKSSEIAAKKADRTASDGLIVVKKEGNNAVMVVLNCETDFVAKNADFQTLAQALAEKAFADGAETARAVAKDMIDPVIQKIGENIVLGDVLSFSGPVIGSYVHNGKSGVVTVLTAGTEELARDIAMHIAAMKPEYLSKSDVPAEKIAMARELFEKEVASIDKPQEIKDKMLQGKLDTYFKEQTLLEQPYIKNPEVTIGALLAKAGAELTSFTRKAIM
jgi:elongation factor Ts